MHPYDKLGIVVQFLETFLLIYNAIAHALQEVYTVKASFLHVTHDLNDLNYSWLWMDLKKKQIKLHNSTFPTAEGWHVNISLHCSCPTEKWKLKYAPFKVKS